MTTLREKNYTSDHHRAWQAFFQKMKNLHVLFSFEQQGFTKKTTDTLTYKHYNIIGFVIKKRVKNWKQKLKQREKKSSSRKKQSFWYYVLHHYYVSCQSLKKNFKLCKTNQQDLKNTHCKRQSLLYVKLRSATEENL